VARAAEQTDWRIAARHYLGAEDLEAVQRVVVDALESVLAMGAYEPAHELVSQLPIGPISGAAGFVIESRLAFRRADAATGLMLAEKGHAADPSSNVALLNLVSARTLAGDVSGAMAANRMLGATAHPSIYAISRAYEMTLSASVRGSVADAERELRALADRMRGEQQPHYLGVALLNLALQQIARGRAQEALASADEAVEVLASASAGQELVSARLARVGALALAGRINDARQELDAASKVAPAGQELEVLMEAAWAEALFGEAARAHSSVERATAGLAVDVNFGEQAIAARALVRIGVGDLAGARADVDLFRWGEPTTSMAFEAQRHLFVALLAILERSPEGLARAANGTALAHAQGADLWRDYGRMLEAFASPTADSSPVVEAIGMNMPVVLSMLAELVVARLGEVGPAALETITAEAMRRPWRWRSAVRQVVDHGAANSRVRAMQLLEQIGEAADVKRLRDAGRRLPGKGGVKAGYALARRLAPPVLVRDLGRVRIVRGDTVTEGHTVRRKVLALLCLLLTKPQFVLTRDEVVDSLWPEHDPASAINSLNQTVYFLRRTLEPEYSDELSPGYVGQDGETIWLDAELIDCSSRRCLEIIRSMPGPPTAEGAVALATAYTGPFALDFAYEDWATHYRDSLHSGYLRVMEHAVRLDLDSGHLERGIFLAERAAEVEPNSDEIHLALTRLYRHSGAHAAAGEQYSHYARAMRDLGLDPLPLSEI
jgi:DNA-binding SARP family transcriptional activator/tetratricopeptide (TPR) repeat protein